MYYIAIHYRVLRFITLKWIVLGNDKSLYCTVPTLIHWTVLCAKGCCTMCNVQCALCNVQRAMCNVQRTCLQICETATQLVGRHKTCKVFLLISPMPQPMICGWFRFEQYSSRFSYSSLSYNFLPVYYYLVSKGKRNVNVSFHEMN